MKKQLLAVSALTASFLAGADDTDFKGALIKIGSCQVFALELRDNNNDLRYLDTLFQVVNNSAKLKPDEMTSIARKGQRAISNLDYMFTPREAARVLINSAACQGFINFGEDAAKQFPDLYR